MVKTEVNICWISSRGYDSKFIYARDFIFCWSDSFVALGYKQKKTWENTNSEVIFKSMNPVSIKILNNIAYELSHSFIIKLLCALIRSLSRVNNLYTRQGPDTNDSGSSCCPSKAASTAGISASSFGTSLKKTTKMVKNRIFGAKTFSNVEKPYSRQKVWTLSKAPFRPLSSAIGFLGIVVPYGSCKAL